MNFKNHKIAKIILSMVSAMMISLGMPNQVSAIDTITLKPTNMIDIQIVNEQGKMVGANVELIRDKTQETYVSDYAYIGSPKIINWSQKYGASNELSFSVNDIVKQILEHQGSEYSIVDVWEDQGDGCGYEIYPEDKGKYMSMDWGEKKLILTHYTDTTTFSHQLDGKKFYIYVDPKIKRGTFRIDDSIYKLTDYREKTMDVSAGKHTVGWNAYQFVKIESSPKAYRTVRVKLSQLDFGDPDIELKDNGRLYVAGEYQGNLFDQSDPYASLVIYDGACVTAPYPDEEGYITYMVEADSKFSYMHLDTYDMGKNLCVPPFYAVRTNLKVCKKIEPKQLGVTGLPAGNYTVKVMPDYYEAVTKTIKVVNSDELQTFQFVTKCEHRMRYHEKIPATCVDPGRKPYYSCWVCERDYLDERGNKELTDLSTLTIDALGHDVTKIRHDASNHWYKCSRCEYTEEKESHIPGAAATEDKPLLCAICNYEMAPKLSHDFIYLPLKEPTCTKEGMKEHFECKNCEHIFEADNADSMITEPEKWMIPSLGHDAALQKKDKSNHQYVCSRCSFVEREEVHKKSAPATDVTAQICIECHEVLQEALGHDASKLEKDDSGHWYACSRCDYKEQKEVHRYSGKYDATCDVCGYIRAVDEGNTTGNQLDSREDLALLVVNGSLKKTDQIQLSWNKVKDATGYEIYWSYCNGKKNFKLLKKQKTAKCVHKNLNTKKAYKYFVAAYKKVNGKKIYLKKSPTIHVAMGEKERTNAKSILLSKKKIVLKQGQSYQLKPRIKKQDTKKKLLNHTKTLRYKSEQKHIATVSKNGTIKAKHQGSATIYVSAENGVSVKVQVVVE